MTVDSVEESTLLKNAVKDKTNSEIFFIKETIIIITIWQRIYLL